jgi:hypothetical protein
MQKEFIILKTKIHCSYFLASSFNFSLDSCTGRLATYFITELFNSKEYFSFPKDIIWRTWSAIILSLSTLISPRIFEGFPSLINVKSFRYMADLEYNYAKMVLWVV